MGGAAVEIKGGAGWLRQVGGQQLGTECRQGGQGIQIKAHTDTVVVWLLHTPLLVASGGKRLHSFAGA